MKFVDISIYSIIKYSHKVFLYSNQIPVLIQLNLTLNITAQVNIYLIYPLEFHTNCVESKSSAV